MNNDHESKQKLAYIIKYHRPLYTIYKVVLDGSVSNIRSLIHLVILQSLGDTTFFKRAIQTDRHTEPINGSKFHHST